MALTDHWIERIERIKLKKEAKKNTIEEAKKEGLRWMSFLCLHKNSSKDTNQKTVLDDSRRIISILMCSRSDTLKSNPRGNHAFEKIKIYI